MYSFLKMLHIISASLFIGMIFGTFYFTFYYRKQLTHSVLKRITHYDQALTPLALFLQPITGFAIIAIKPYPTSSPWVLETIGLYTIIGCLWLVSLFQQQRLLHRYEHSTSVNSTPFIVSRTITTFSNFIALTVLYYLMVHRPT